MTGKDKHHKGPQHKKPETLIVQSLLKTGLFLQRELNQVCQRHGMNTIQFSVLNEVVLEGPISQKDLCLRLLLEKSNLSKIVKVLQGKQLISVVLAPHDRRLTLLIETDRGTRLLQECLQQIHQACTDLMSTLSGEEIADTRAILNRLDKAFRRKAEE